MNLKLATNVRNLRDTPRRGVALLIALGVLAVMYLVIFAVIGGQASHGTQTVDAQSQTVALSEERSAILRALNRWVSDGRQERLEMSISVLSDWIAKTSPGFGERMGKPEKGADNTPTVQISIQTATPQDAEYSKAGIVHKAKDIWVEAHTPISGQGVVRRALYLCREGDFARATLVKEENVMRNER